MSIYCTKCEKEFRYKGSFEKHMNRKFSCRKALFKCTCNKHLVSKDSLRTHKRLYCKNSIFDEILKASPDPVASNVKPKEAITPTNATVESVPEVFESTLTPDAESELDEILKPSIPVDSTTTTTIHTPNLGTISQVSQSYLLKDLEDILTDWLNGVFVMDGIYRIHKTTKSEIDNSLHRLLEDGLINQQDFDDLSYTTNLTFRLRELITMPVPAMKKSEIMDILTEFLLIKKIIKEAYLVICNLIC